MTKRITGRLLLPLTLAAGSALAMAAPAAALESLPDPAAAAAPAAPAPTSEKKQKEECVQAVDMLTELRLLQRQDGLVNILCEIGQPKKDKGKKEQDARKEAEDRGLLTLPTLPENLIVKIPGLREPAAAPAPGR
ncbi:hypothetical protein [Actinomadura roseirufa]|uniref:hypothetical protein n=1 Tax=Actinomadura roseirufa TaxID=2094049 RepID=UPI0010411B97|nr:hypothetical protein [Actinomadura roseirufa]